MITITLTIASGVLGFILGRIYTRMSVQTKADFWVGQYTSKEEATQWLRHYVRNAGHGGPEWWKLKVNFGSQTMAKRVLCHLIPDNTEK